MLFFFGLVTDQVAALRREQAAFHWQALNQGRIDLEHVEEHEHTHAGQD